MWIRNPYREWHDTIEYLGRQNRRPLNSWLGGQERVYIPFDPEHILEPNDDDEKIIELLEEEGFEIFDYRGGYCKRPGTTQLRRIGKVLNALRKKDLKEQEEKHRKGELYNLQLAQQRTNKYFDDIFRDFTSSPYRNAAELTRYTVVISQNPHDIARMSTDRNWESCMTLGSGAHHKEIFKEVVSGGLIAYLIRNADLEISKPLARIWIRHFKNIRTDESIAMAEESVYGEDISGFMEFVNDWIDEHQGEITGGLYALQGGQYSDSFSMKMHLGGTWELPDDPAGILSYYRGEGLDDIPYKVWIVSNRLPWYHDEEDEDYEDEDKEFFSEEDAEDYIAGHRLSMDDYWRETEDENLEEPYWTLVDDSEEFVNEPLSIEEKIIDQRPELQAKAASRIVAAKPGIYPIEVIRDIKNQYPAMKKDILTKYPQLFSQEELEKLSRYDLVRFIDALPQEEQLPHIRQIDEKFKQFVNEPYKFLPSCIRCGKSINPEAEEVVPCSKYEILHHAHCPGACILMTREDEKRSGAKPEHTHSYYKTAVYNLSSDIINPYRHFHSREYTHAEPVPEDLVQKLISTPERTYLIGHPQLHLKSEILHFLHMVHADTPRVQEFYKSLLPYWKYEFTPREENFFLRQREHTISINNLGSAIAALGINGRQFIPFIKGRLEQIRQQFGDAAFDPNAPLTGEPWSPEYPDKSRILRVTEKYLYILDALESGTGRSNKYSFTF